MPLDDIRKRTAERLAAGANQTYPRHRGKAKAVVRELVARAHRRPLVLLPPIAACKHGGSAADIMERCDGCAGGAKHGRECEVHTKCTHESVNPAVMDCRKCQLEGLGFEPATRKATNL